MSRLLPNPRVSVRKADSGPRSFHFLVRTLYLLGR